MKGETALAKSDSDRRVGAQEGERPTGAGMGDQAIIEREVIVEIVFDPPWDRDMMSDAAKLNLGLP